MAELNPHKICNLKVIALNVNSIVSNYKREEL